MIIIIKYMRVVPFYFKLDFLFKVLEEYYFKDIFYNYITCLLKVIWKVYI